MDVDETKRFDGNSKRSTEERRKQRFHVHLQQDGGNPSQLLDLLCLVVEEEDWMKFAGEDGEPLTFQDYITSPYPVGVGWDREELLSTLRLKHRNEGKDKEISDRIESMRSKVKALTLTPLSQHGDPELGKKFDLGRGRSSSVAQKTSTVPMDKIPIPEYNEEIADGDFIEAETPVIGDYNIISDKPAEKPPRKPRNNGTGESYSLQRLKRDAQPYYDKVIAGEMKANKAMIESGLRKPTPKFSTDPRKLAQTIREVYDDDKIKELIELLRQTK